MSPEGLGDGAGCCRVLVGPLRAPKRGRSGWGAGEGGCC